MSNYYSISQLAKLWQLHPITIRRYIREGKLQAQKIGGRIRIQKTAAQNMTRSFKPNPKTKPSHLFKKSQGPFTLNDPIWRLKGIGSSSPSNTI